MESHLDPARKDEFLKDLQLARSLTPGGIVPMNWWVAAAQALALESPSEMLPEVKFSLKEAAALMRGRGVVGSIEDQKTLSAVLKAFPGNEDIRSAIMTLTANAVS